MTQTVTTAGDDPGDDLDRRLGAIEHGAAAIEQAERELVALLKRETRRTTGRPTDEQLLAALAAGGFPVSRATIYNWIRRGRLIVLRRSKRTA